MGIDINLVKKLREITGLSISECKKALIEANGDIEKAQEILKKYGAKVAGKKADRETKEGKIGIFTKDGKVVIIELNSETDFVANNEEFNNLLEKIGNIAIENDVNSAEELLSIQTSEGSVKDLINEAIGKIKENIVLKTVKTIKYDPSKEVIGEYLHMGKIAGVVVLETEKVDDDKVKDLAKKLAIQVASMNVEKISKEDYTEEELNALKEDILKDPVFEGKPDHVKEKILENKLNAIFEEKCLLEQELIMDEQYKVKEYIDKVAKEVGVSIKVKEVVKVSLGS